MSSLDEHKTTITIDGDSADFSNVKTWMFINLNQDFAKVMHPGGVQRYVIEDVTSVIGTRNGDIITAGREGSR
jgi:hypothetical protein